MGEDIVTRLTEWLTAPYNPYPPRDARLILDARAEIERLRDKEQDLRMFLEQDACEIERLRAEVARLGAFLHPIGEQARRGD